MKSKLIVINRQDRIIGFEEKEKCHDGKGILHRAFSIFIFNNKRELLIQQRSELKRLWPLFWSNTCCSHPRFNEEIAEASEKRLIKEFGISCALQELYKFHYSAKYGNIGSENEICSVLIGRSKNDQSLIPNLEEIADYRWVNINRLKKDIKKNSNKYSPWFKIEVQDLFSNYLKEINELF